MKAGAKNLLLFVVFIAITFLLYLPTLHSKFVFDFVDLYFDYQSGGFASIWQSGTSMVSRLILYSLIKTVGLNEWVWFFLATLLHSANALLLLWLLQNLLRWVGYVHVNMASFLTALVFLFSPYHTEVVVWGGAFNYLLVSFFVLLHLNVFCRLVQGYTHIGGVIAFVSFLLASFSHEWGFFVLPVDALLLLIAWQKNRDTELKPTLLVWSVCSTITAFYFSALFITGRGLGHYGTETHLRLKFNELLIAVYNYLFKILLLSPFWPATFQTKFHTLLNSANPFLLFAMLLALIALVFFIYKRNKPALIALALLAFLFTIFIFPVLNLYFPYWTYIQGDRYCYLPLAFICGAIITLLFYKSATWPIGIVAVYILLSIYFLKQNTARWKIAGEMLTKLENDFPTDTTKNYYLLNVPDNYQGAYMFRNLGKSCFAQTMRMKTGIDRNRHITDLQNYNMVNVSDSVIVSVVDSATLQVELNRWGNWWRRGTNVENAYFAMKEDEYNHSYRVVFKQKSKNDVFLYQANGKWKQVENF